MQSQNEMTSTEGLYCEVMGDASQPKSSIKCGDLQVSQAKNILNLFLNHSTYFRLYSLLFTRTAQTLSTMKNLYSILPTSAIAVLALVTGNFQILARCPL